MTTEPVAYPFKRPSALDPPKELADLRKRPAVPVTLPSGDRAVLVTRHEDVRSVLCDPRVSRNMNRPGAARITHGNAMFNDERINPDPPEHTRVRRLVMHTFSAARVESLRPSVQAIADSLVDTMAAGSPPADVNEALAFPLSIQVVCELLGVPGEDRDRFRDWTDAFLSVSRFPPEQIRASMMELRQYIGDLIEAKRVAPGEDLISGLIAVHDDDDGRLTEYELHWWTRLLLLVGYETTATQIAGSVALLLAHPDQLHAVREDMTLLPGAIEEMLRWKLVGSSVSMLRYVTEDIEVGGEVIPAGTSVIPAADSANQDERVFADPWRFDVTRTDNHHLTFSAGPHFCIGAALARLELQIALSTLLARFPKLHLGVPPGELRRYEGALLEGFVEVPVAW
ncbi:MAG TPA: cytochrome P450 [Rugosimonospora sp.]|nr:cytochrome P450 [Rugosimonospora sp.]